MSDFLKVISQSRKKVHEDITVFQSQRILRNFFTKPNEDDEIAAQVFYGFCELIINEWWIPEVADIYELPEIIKEPRCCTRDKEGMFECLECLKRDKIISDKDQIISDKDQIISDKDLEIAILRAKIKDFEERLAREY